jgi:hypothetical protein
LQEPESIKVVGSVTGHLTLDLVRVNLISEAQLRHTLNALGEIDSDPTRSKADHTLAVLADTIDPIY